MDLPKPVDKVFHFEKCAPQHFRYKGVENPVLLKMSPPLLLDDLLDRMQEASVEAEQLVDQHQGIFYGIVQAAFSACCPSIALPFHSESEQIRKIVEFSLVETTKIKQNLECTTHDPWQGMILTSELNFFPDLFVYEVFFCPKIRQDLYTLNSLRHMTYILVRHVPFNQ